MSTALATLTISRLSELLVYDESTGVLSWKRTGKGRKIGRVAGSPDRHGYLQTRIDGKAYFNHRLAWAITHGSFPAEVIDHIDGNKLNNALNNLRDVTRRVNQENQRRAPVSNRSTGLLGATLHVKTGKFMAKIQVMRKQIYLGLFETAEGAHEAYLSAKRQIHQGVTI